MHQLHSLPASFFMLHVLFVLPLVTLPLNTSPTITTTPWGCNTSCTIRGWCEQLVTLGVRNAPSGICVLGSSFELLVFVSFLGGFEKGSTIIYKNATQTQHYKITLLERHMFRKFLFKQNCSFQKHKRVLNLVSDRTVF